MTSEKKNTASALRRLASLSHPPRLARAAISDFLARRAHLIALALFAAVGLAVFDDYGTTFDDSGHRMAGHASFNYVAGNADDLTGYRAWSDKYYGVAFELPLVAFERLLRLEDPRAIYLSRHLLTHLLFLVGGFFAWLLAYRMFGNRLAALFAMAVFLLHPRIYAHSFFNTKDPPFFSMFMVSLYLVHRAFRRDTVGAFALCGAGAALLMNIRIMGVMLFPAVLGMLALDAFRAARRGDGAKPILANAAAFIAAFIAALYASWPLLWREPLAWIDAFQVLGVHPDYVASMFRGELIRWPDIPWDFVPTWILITTPPVVLALAALGAASVGWLCAARPRAALENSTARFGLLMVACLVLPVAGVVALNSNLYNDWRQMYFLYAPMSVLAAFGLRALASLPKPSVRAGAFALVALGGAVVVVQMVSLHPYQNVYFSPLMGRDGIAGRWAMDYLNTSHREALETLLEMQPTGRIAASTPFAYLLTRHLVLIPADERRRLYIGAKYPSFRVVSRDGGERSVWQRSAYGVPMVSILDLRAESEAAFERDYAAALASEPAATAGGFDIRRVGDSLTYIKEDCGEGDTIGTFSLRVFPSRHRDLPAASREGGLDYELSRFDFFRYGAVFGGRCLISAPLPDYPIHALETDKSGEGGERPLWRASIPLAESLDDYAAALAALPPEPTASAGGFAIYADADGESLAYVKRGCSGADARARFFLSAFPADLSDLPQSAREAGLKHEPLNFEFHRYGARVGGDCVIVRRLPGYPIIRAETGQWTPGEGELWSAEVSPPAYWERYMESLASAPPDASGGGFGIWLNGGRLTYVKRGCDEDDVRRRFFLSAFPADPSDLPQSAREAGWEHEPLNFDFRDYGVVVDGDCAIVRDLPGYPLSAIETGQWTPNEGELWRARMEAGE